MERGREREREKKEEKERERDGARIGNFLSQNILVRQVRLG